MQHPSHPVIGEQRLSKGLVEADDRSPVHLKRARPLQLSGSRLHGIGIRMDLSTVQRWDQAACEPGRICWKQ